MRTAGAFRPRRGGPGGGITVSQDLEPEFVTVAPDGRTAYVGLQEANAVAIVDLSDPAAPEVSDIVALALGAHFGRRYAFVGLERVGGIMVLDITDPAEPVFAETDETDLHVRLRFPGPCPLTLGPPTLGPPTLAVGRLPRLAGLRQFHAAPPQLADCSQSLPPLT